MFRKISCLTVLTLLVFLFLIHFSSSVAFAAIRGGDEMFTRAWTAYELGRYPEAKKLWETLADQGHVGAKINLGVMYDSGRGVAENPVTAAKWYESAAFSGDPSAQFNLGLMYEEGRGVPEDYSLAAIWYKKAAEQNFGEAQHMLGVLHVAGKGVSQSPEIGINWFYKSGLSFLQDGDTEGAMRAFHSINNTLPEHAYGKKLLQQIPATATGKYAPPPSFDISGAATGTAWPIVGGYVVTNDHVIAGSSYVVVVNASGEEMTAWPVARDKFSDIAVLEVSDTGKLPPALPLGRSVVNTGTTVFTIGFPRIDVLGISPKLTDGIVSQLTGINGRSGSFQTTVPIQPGNSGGPLLNMNGEVVGVVKAMLAMQNEATGEITVLKNASAAQKVKSLFNLLEGLPRRDIGMEILPRRHDNLSNLATRIQDSVLIVLAR